MGTKRKREKEKKGQREKEKKRKTFMSRISVGKKGHV